MIGYTKSITHLYQKCKHLFGLNIDKTLNKALNKKLLKCNTYVYKVLNKRADYYRPIWGGNVFAII